MKIKEQKMKMKEVFFYSADTIHIAVIPTFSILYKKKKKNQS